MSRRLFTNLQLATMAGEGPYGLREDHAVGIEDGHVAFVAPVGEVPAGWAEPEDLGGRLVTPALIDCHTHVVAPTMLRQALVFGVTRSRSPTTMRAGTVTFSRTCRRSISRMSWSVCTQTSAGAAMEILVTCSMCDGEASGPKFVARAIR
jgi:urease alpha subunit